MKIASRALAAAAVCLLSFAVFFVPGIRAAAYETVDAEIPVYFLEISDSSTRIYEIKIERENDSAPVPVSDKLEKSENGTGRFRINITEPGTFNCKVYELAGSDPDIKYDSYIYTLSVPNTKADTELALLTIEKQVNGAFGNKEREFIFTVEITDAGDGDAFVWAKNGEEQTAMPGTGTTFTMKHNDRVEISLPAGVGVTVTEDNEEYTASMKLDSQESIEGNTISFTFSGSDVLTVTNTLDGTVPSGLSSNIRTALALIALPLLPVGCILYCKRRRRKAAV